MKTTFKTRVRGNEARKKRRYYLSYTNIVSDHDKLIKIALDKYIIVIYIDDVTTLKQLYYRTKYAMQSKYQKASKRFNHWRRYNFDNKPYYYAYSHTDCDLVYSERVGKFDSYTEAYDYQSNPDNYDWLEGAYSEWEISEAEYLDRLGCEYQRDYIMEAYENGNGRKIFV